jgi:hypothetical protein
MSKVTLDIDPDVALVLFAWLAAQPPFNGADTNWETAEGIALNSLLGTLEKTLVEPFRSDYAELVADARSRLEKSISG